MTRLSIPAFVVAIAIALFPASLPAMAGDAAVPTPRPDPAAQAPATEGLPADPPVIHRRACPAYFDRRVQAILAPPKREGECGADSPLQLQAAADVKFTGEPMVTCEMAVELAEFAALSAAAARHILGSELKEIVTGPGYQCRRRNRAATGKLSEHAFANALDIAGFRLDDGREITIAQDWPRIESAPEDSAPDAETGGSEEREISVPADRATRPEQKFLAEVHAAACRRFTTVLGPDSDTAHESHLHLDLGCHGRDCRYLICQ